MVDDQTPIEAPTGTTSTDVPAAPPQKPKRKRGRPKKIQPGPIPAGSSVPAVPFPADTISPARATFSRDLQELRDRVTALEAKNAEAPPPTDTRTNLERAKDRSRLRIEAQAALAAK